MPNDELIAKSFNEIREALLQREKRLNDFIAAENASLRTSSSSASSTINHNAYVSNASRRLQLIGEKDIAERFYNAALSLVSDSLFKSTLLQERESVVAKMEKYRQEIRTIVQDDVNSREGWRRCTRLAMANVALTESINDIDLKLSFVVRAAPDATTNSLRLIIRDDHAQEYVRIRSLEHLSHFLKKTKMPVRDVAKLIEAKRDMAREEANGYAAFIADVSHIGMQQQQQQLPSFRLPQMRLDALRSFVANLESYLVYCSQQQQLQ